MPKLIAPHCFFNFRLLQASTLLSVLVFAFNLKAQVGIESSTPSVKTEQASTHELLNQRTCEGSIAFILNSIQVNSLNCFPKDESEMPLDGNWPCLADIMDQSIHESELHPELENLTKALQSYLTQLPAEKGVVSVQSGEKQCVLFICSEEAPIKTPFVKVQKALFKRFLEHSINHAVKDGFKLCVRGSKNF